MGNWKRDREVKNKLAAIAILAVVMLIIIAATIQERKFKWDEFLYGIGSAIIVGTFLYLIRKRK